MKEKVTMLLQFKSLVTTLCLLGVTEAIFSQKEIVSNRNNPKHEYSANSPLNFSVGATPATFDTACNHILSTNESDQVKNEARAILALRDKSSDWYGVSYLNGFLGAMILLPGAIWWASGGPVWLFAIGAVQHGSAYFTGYLSSKWSRESADRFKRLMTVHNASITTIFQNTQGITISFKF